MKKLIVLTLFITLKFSLGYTQQVYEAVYTMKVDEQRMSQFMAQVSENTKDYLQGLSNAANGAQFSLIFSNDKAVFQLTDKLHIDDMKALMVSGFLVSFRLSGTIYSDVNTHKIYQLKEAGSATHLLELPLENINWKITSESKTYGKYTLYKAIAIYKNKSTYALTAWFCKEVPTSFGPGLYAGLPGLIMDLTVDQQQKGGFKFSLKLETLTKENKTISIPFDKYKVRTQQESDAIYEKLNSNSRPD